MLLLDHFFALILLLFPGAWISWKLDLETWSARIGMGFIFSLVTIGIAVYSISWAVPVKPLFLVFLAVLSFFLVWRSKKSILEYYGIPVPPLNGLQKGIILGTIILGVFISIHAWQHTMIEYDSLSYHIPFVEYFATQGNVPTFAAPLNAFEVRANYYPKFYEAIVGGVRQLSEPVSHGVPIIALVGLLFLLHACTRKIDAHAATAPVLLLASGFFLNQFMSDLGGIFISLCFVAAAYLVVENKRADSSSVKSLCVGLLCGALIATHLTGMVYAGVLGIYFLATTLRLRAIGAWIVGMMTAGIGFFIPYLSRHTVTTAQLGIGSFHPITTWADWYTVPLQNGTVLIEFISAYPFWADSLFLSSMAAMGLLIYFLLKSRFDIVSGVHALLLLSTGSLLIFLSIGLWGETVSAHGLLRYMLPGMVLSIIAGTKCIDWIGRRHRLFAPMLVIALLLIGGIFLGISYTNHDSRATFGDALVDTLNVIPNESQTTVYFANTPNPIIHHLEKARVRDFIAFAAGYDSKQGGCSFLSAQGVTHVVVVFPFVARNISELDNRIVQDAQAQACGKVVGELLLPDTNAGQYHWMEIFQLSPKEK